MASLVVGLGNPMLTDDGVGVLVARAVEQALATRVHSQVEVVEASVGGLRLMEMMVGYDRVILVDALLGGGEVPGTVLRWTLADLDTMAPTQHWPPPTMLRCPLRWRPQGAWACRFPTTWSSSPSRPRTWTSLAIGPRPLSWQPFPWQQQPC